MPSSTSNSEFPSDRAPRKGWLFCWALTLLVSWIAIASAEIFWRSRGHRPSVVDDYDLWALERSKVYAGGKKTVVLLGNSRMQLGFSSKTFEKRFPDYHLVNLAVSGRHPIATLRDLADDDEFRGTIICAIEPSGFLKKSWEQQQEYVDYYHRVFSMPNKIDCQIRRFFQSRLTVLYPGLRLKDVISRAVKHRRLPKPRYVIMHSDRSRSADYTLARLTKLQKRRVDGRKEVTSYSFLDDWLEDVTEVEAIVRQLEEKGRHVVFVTFPTSGRLYKLNETVFPKQTYWDRFVATTSATAIHFKDVPALSLFKCPDYSHLDCRDAPKFTNNLLDEIVRHEVFEMFSSLASDERRAIKRYSLKAAEKLPKILK